MLFRLLFGRGAAQSTPPRRTQSAPTFRARPGIEFLEGRLAPSDLVVNLAPDPAQTPVAANLPAMSTVAPPPVLVISPVAPPANVQSVPPQTATSLMGTLQGLPIAGSPEVASNTPAAATTIAAGFTEDTANTYSIVGDVTVANVNGYTVSFSGISELQGRVVKVNRDGSFGTTFGWAPGGANTRTVNVALVAPSGSTCAQCQVTIHQTPA